MEHSSGDYEEEIRSVLDELQNLYPFLPGPILQKVLRFKAQTLLDKPEEELKMILHLVESHIPGLRLRAKIKSQTKSYENKSENHHSTKKDHRSYLFSSETPEADLLKRIAELPKEWTVVQLTSQFFSKEIFRINSDDLTLNGVHITVFNCGTLDAIPYCITLPKGNAHSIRGDIQKMKKDLLENCRIPQFDASVLTTKKNRLKFYKRRIEIDDSLECLLREIEESWLGAWKCLFIGKFKDVSLENDIQKLLQMFYKEQSLEIPTKKVQSILIQMVKNIISTSANDLTKNDKFNTTILDYCFPGKNLKNSWDNFWNKHQIYPQNTNRYPVIFIIDETLDCFPWEMLSILKGQPSSRMFSLHLLYDLFKSHQNSIVNGYKIISNNGNGSYILNPGLDLRVMEKRLKSFFDYWLPQWKGIVAKSPSTKEFIDSLTSSEIFCYSGHGSGSQYCSSDKIQKEKIDSVVFLLGCASTQLVEQGPEAEMFGVSQMYLLADCPCLIGMLWLVTDIDTDVLSTDLLSTWIPNWDKPSWQLVDKDEWSTTGIIKIKEEKSCTFSAPVDYEPDLLKALSLAKYKNRNKCNRASVVARGLPVKYI